jgi:hypothetical protein
VKHYACPNCSERASAEGDEHPLHNCSGTHGLNIHLAEVESPSHVSEARHRVIMADTPPGVPLRAAAVSTTYPTGREDRVVFYADAAANGLGG